MSGSKPVSRRNLSYTVNYSLYSTSSHAILNTVELRALRCVPIADMRLLNAKNLHMKEFFNEKVPSYVIVSHRWEEDEVTYKDFESRTFYDKKGFQKIKESCRIAIEANCHWIWLDTCCIDKSNSVELNEAINAMYKWYQNSSFCIAYLFDHEDNVNGFSQSTWFQRCWTLQELIAPRYVRFYDRNWKNIGSKHQRRGELAAITRIDNATLSGADPKDCSIAQRMSWAAGRKATRIEDEAYSLLGLFGLNMPTLYGSGDRAFQSLQEELLQRTDDQSIFAWHETPVQSGNEYHGLLAKSPAAFASCENTRSTASSLRSASLVGGGVELDVLTIPYTVGTYLCALDCTSTKRTDREAILLEQLEHKDQYARVMNKWPAFTSIPLQSLVDNRACERRTLYVRHLIRDRPLNLVRGFWIRRLELPGYDAESLEQIRICSRLDGRVDHHRDPALVQLSEQSWGTAGLAYIPVENSSSRWPLIRWVKFGFDATSCPMIQLGNDKLRCAMQQISAATTNPPSSSSREYHDVWNNDWVTLTDRRQTRKSYGGEEIELSNKEYFKDRGYKKLRIKDFKEFDHAIKYLRLRVKISLIDCPAHIASRQPSACGPGPWKIWTVDITKTGTFPTFPSKADSRTSNFAIGASVVGAILLLRSIKRS